MTLLSQLAYPGPALLQPAAALTVWAALNRSLNPAAVSQVLGMYVAIAPSLSKTVTGFFQDQTGAGISRSGYAIDRTTGAFITSFTSAAGTGAFTFHAPSTAPVIIILVPNIGDSRNAIILDDIVPI